ncbi:MAG: 16S rRNA (cytosine(1402)-N(4))-methyltransferase RsmH [Alphaproteobacteria bacterium GM7ARS4]|nr:16S rRNA (cytosine(1402)-N(4))-methyltransferase RsmH [Alphaproteobacteria bacterium GM7ARS4]
MDGRGHRMVMMDRILSYCSVRENGMYIDATFGAGGCSYGLLSSMPCRVVAMDCDGEAMRRSAMVRDLFGERFSFIQGRFSSLEESVRSVIGDACVHGVIFDLGVSSMQLDDGCRGFSFMRDGPLDMRMGGEKESHVPSAGDVVNTASESALADIFYHLGEERRARHIASRIVHRRRERPFTRTLQLADVVVSALGGRRHRLHPATRVFLALRLYVNRELEELRAALPQALSLLTAGGRLLVMSFHSLEDRLVKRFMRLHAGHAVPPSHSVHASSTPSMSLRLLHKHVITPSREEVARNPRARSAKLRVAEKRPITARGVMA